jgi:DNA modification methylase
MGEHRLLCGDARDGEAVQQLMAQETARMVFTDPPYNVKIDGHVGGAGRVKHREFAMASGEMSQDQFARFLTEVLANMADASCDGSIHLVCMDWRHMTELMAAGGAVYDELKNLIVWAKTNGGMGTFYRSRHELIFVFKKGKEAHINTFGLGESGRYRTNVWDYPGINTFRDGRDEELAMHPTVKPVALVADAIKDVSRRGHIVLDAFGGSGTTLIAAEKTGRNARLLELDPAYCDVICRRFEAYAGRPASGQTCDSRREPPSLRRGCRPPNRTGACGGRVMSGPARYTALGRKGLLRTPTEPIMPDGMVSRCRSWLDALDKPSARARQQRAPAGPVGGA